MRVAKLAATILIVTLLARPSYAQPFPESDRQKGAEALKKAEEKATDQAYRAAMKRAPNATKKIDPWGSIRTPSENSDK